MKQPTSSWQLGLSNDLIWRDNVIISLDKMTSQKLFWKFPQEFLYFLWFTTNILRYVIFSNFWSFLQYQFIMISFTFWNQTPTPQHPHPPHPWTPTTPCNPIPTHPPPGTALCTVLVTIPWTGSHKYIFWIRSAFNSLDFVITIDN